MKLSAVFLTAAALAGTSSAYKISVYSKDNYQGTQKSWTSAGSHSVGFTVKSWIWESPLGDGCCIAFCKGSTVSLMTLFGDEGKSGSRIARDRTSDGIAMLLASPSPAPVSPRSLPGAARLCSTAKRLAKGVYWLNLGREGDGFMMGTRKKNTRRQLLYGLVAT